MVTLQRKSVYSLILSDCVIEHVDALAYQSGMSRSAMINHILAGQLSLTTPEQQMRSILSLAEELLKGTDTLVLLPTLADGMLAVKAPVRFKYNPTIRYTVELRSIATGLSGELRAAARTQSESLTEALDHFFMLFVSEAGLDPNRVTVENGRFVFSFLLSTSDAEEGAKQIAGLIQLIQRAMKGFFDAHPNQTACTRAVRQIIEYQRRLLP